MIEGQNNVKLAQSASALGAGLLGFGLGARWGNVITDYALIIIIVGTVFACGGMYITQMKKNNEKSSGIAKVLWASAWACLIISICNRWYLILHLNLGNDIKMQAGPL